MIGCDDKSKEDRALLRVISECSREFLELFFGQCITDPILRKHEEKTWILQMPNKSGNPSINTSKVLLVLADHEVVSTSELIQGTQAAGWW